MVVLALILKKSQNCYITVKLYREKSKKKAHPSHFISTAKKKQTSELLMTALWLWCLDIASQVLPEISVKCPNGYSKADLWLQQYVQYWSRMSKPLVGGFDVCMCAHVCDGPPLFSLDENEYLTPTLFPRVLTSEHFDTKKVL